MRQPKGELTNGCALHKSKENNADCSVGNAFAVIVLKLVCVITDFGHTDVISQISHILGFFFPSYHPKGTLVQHTLQR